MIIKLIILTGHSVGGGLCEGLCGGMAASARTANIAATAAHCLHFQLAVESFSSVRRRYFRDSVGGRDGETT